MEKNETKKRTVPQFKNLGFIVPKKKRPSEKTGASRCAENGSSAENSPSIVADEGSNSSTANLFDVSEPTSTDQIASDRQILTTDTKSVSEVQKAKKQEFVKPFSAIFKAAASKKLDTDTNSSNSEVNTDAKHSHEKSSKIKVVGTPLTDEQYEDIFSAVMDRVSQMDSTSIETACESRLQSSTWGLKVNLGQRCDQSYEGSNVLPQIPDKKHGESVNKINKIEKPVFAKPSTANVLPAVTKNKRPTAPNKTAPNKVSAESITKIPFKPVVKNVAKKESPIAPPVKSIPKKSPVKVGKEKKQELITEQKLANEADNNMECENTSISVVTKDVASASETFFERPPTMTSNVSTNKHVQSNKSKQSANSLPKSSATELKEKQSCDAKSNQSDKMMSITTDDQSSSENEDKTVNRAINTQMTKWGKDRGIIYNKPPKRKTYKERMIYLRECRNIGLWVKCTIKGCGKWRYCHEMKDPLQVPESWNCSMNLDTEFNSCNEPEQRQPTELVNEVDIISGKYSAGSIVWAMIAGWPWWPAMVDDDPNVEMFWWLDNQATTQPNWYHVVFFDRKNQKVERAWVTERCIEPFDPNNNYRTHLQPKFVSKKDKSLPARFMEAREEATKALEMPVPERLERYGFLARYRGPIRRPTLEIDSSSEEEDSQRRNTTNLASPSTYSFRNRSSRKQDQHKTRKRRRVNKLKKMVKKLKLVKNTLRSPSKSSETNSDSENEDDQVDDSKTVDEDQLDQEEDEDVSLDGTVSHGGEDLQEVTDVTDDVAETVKTSPVNKDSSSTFFMGQPESSNKDVANDKIDDGNRDEGKEEIDVLNNDGENEEIDVSEKEIDDLKMEIDVLNKEIDVLNKEMDVSNNDAKNEGLDVGSVYDNIAVNIDAPVFENNDCELTTDDEWSDKSIISDVDSNASINVDDLTSCSTIDLCSTSDGGSDENELMDDDCDGDITTDKIDRN